MSPDSAGLRRPTLFVAGSHAAIALVYWLLFGVSIVHDFGPDKWGWFWQNLPTELLRERALESVWYMHGQPPLWNLLGALLIKLFGFLHMEALQVVHIAMGAAIAGMCVQIVARITRAPRLAVAVGLAVALHPALFLYEAYALYTTSATFLVTLTAYFITRAQEGVHEEGNGKWVLALVAAGAALTMTRSVYHVIVMFGLLPLAWVLLGRPTRRQLILLVVLALIPAGWYAKNRVQYGFFGASSWYGMGLWRTALFQQDNEVLSDLFERGLLSPVVQVETFSPPSVYERFGYDRESSVAVLSANNQHNVNVPDISRDYRSSASVLIRNSPAQYFRNVLTAYGNFSAPSTDFIHLEDNRARIRWHAAVEQTLLGRPLAARLEASLGQGYYGSFYYLLLPAVLLIYGFQVSRRLSLRGVPQRLRDDAAPLFMAGIVFYTIAIACAMELGENVRFKFMIEPVFLVLAAIVLHRLFATPGAAGADSSSGESPDLAEPPGRVNARPA